MSRATRNAPYGYRALVLMFSALFGILAFWLLGFALSDIESGPGPDYSSLEDELLDKDLVESANLLEHQVRDTNRRIKEMRNRQSLLKDSIENSTRTMDQLLEIQRRSLERDAELPEEAESAMSENIALFLSNQRRYQEFNEEIARLNEELLDLEARDRAAQRRLDDARDPIRERFEEELERHDLRIAALKMAVLVPLAILLWVAYVRLRGGSYTPFLYAASAALAIRMMLVMHEHFPQRYFKYVLILIALGIVAWILLQLLKAISRPSPALVLKQRRDAYESFFCPACGYPIRRGPLKYLAWTRRSLRKLALRERA